MARTRVGIAGITGRMGRVLVQTALELPTVALGAASSRSQDELVVGQDAGEFVGVPAAGVAISGSLRYCRESFDVAIDFTQPEYSGELAAFCAEEGKPLVIGTTGHEEAQLAPVRAAAARVPVTRGLPSSAQNAASSPLYSGRVKSIATSKFSRQ